MFSSHSSPILHVVTYSWLQDFQHMRCCVSQFNEGAKGRVAITPEIAAVKILIDFSDRSVDQRCDVLVIKKILLR